jgi:hypothetical protein
MGSPSLTIYFDAPPVTQSASPVYQLEKALGDAFTFIRSCEVNQAFAAVTMAQLINDQIARNGSSQEAKQSTYNPYSYDPTKTAPASQGSAQTPNNTVSGADTNQPTKLDRIVALVNNIQNIVQAIQKLPLVEVADPTDYANSVQNSSGTPSGSTGTAAV